jgi:hypothetical protein
MHSSGEENIKEYDEVILELDMSSNNPIAKAKRNVSNRSTLPWIVILCCFMICAFGSLVIVLVAQMAAIPDAPATWAAMSLSSSTPNAIPLCSIRSLDFHFFYCAGSFQGTNIRTALRLNQSLLNTTSILNPGVAEAKANIETRWLDAQMTSSFRIQKLIRWKRLSQNVTNVTETFFASLPRSGTCVACRAEQALADAVDFEGGIAIPNVSIAAPASSFWNNSAVSTAFNMLQSVIANETQAIGNLPSYVLRAL